MKAGTSTPGEDRESGPITRSGICQRVDDLPQAGHSRRDQVHTHNDGELFWPEKGQNGSPPKEAAGRPPHRRAGLGSRYGGGATSPVCGDCPAPPSPSRNGPCQGILRCGLCLDRPVVVGSRRLEGVASTYGPLNHYYVSSRGRPGELAWGRQARLPLLRLFR